MSADSEQAIALYEAERNRAWHSWFAARGHIPPTYENTLKFDGCFRMAWELCRAKPAPQPAEQQPDLTHLVEALTTARETIAAALRANELDYFATDADIARHVAIQPIDTAIAVFRKQGVTND